MKMAKNNRPILSTNRVADTTKSPHPPATTKQQRGRLHVLYQPPSLPASPEASRGEAVVGLVEAEPHGGSLVHAAAVVGRRENRGTAPCSHHGSCSQASIIKNPTRTVTTGVERVLRSVKGFIHSKKRADQKKKKNRGWLARVRRKGGEAHPKLGCTFPPRTR